MKSPSQREASDVILIEEPNGPKGGIKTSNIWEYFYKGFLTTSFIKMLEVQIHYPHKFIYLKVERAPTKHGEF